MAKPSHIPQKPFRERYPNIRIHDDGAYIVKLDGTVVPYDHEPINEPPLVVIDVSAKEHEDPRKLEKLWAHYRSNFVDVQANESVMAMLNAGPWRGKTQQRRNEIFAESKRCDVETAARYFAANNDTERVEILGEIYDHNLNDLRERLKIEHDKDINVVLSQEIPKAIKAFESDEVRAHFGEKPLLRAERRELERGRAEARATLEKEIHNLPDDYLTVLNEQHFDYNACIRYSRISNGGENGGVNLMGIGQVIFAINKNVVNKLGDRRLLQDIHEETFHAVDAALGFSDRQAWARAVEHDVKAPTASIIFKAAMETSYTATAKGNMDYLTGRGFDYPSMAREVLVDIAAFEKYGSRIMRKFVKTPFVTLNDVGEQVIENATLVDLKKAFEEVDCKPAAFLEKHAPELWAQYELFKSDLAEKASAIRAAKTQGAPATHAEKTASSKGTGHGGIA